MSTEDDQESQQPGRLEKEFFIQRQRHSSLALLIPPENSFSILLMSCAYTSAFWGNTVSLIKETELGYGILH